MANGILNTTTESVNITSLVTMTESPASSQFRVFPHLRLVSVFWQGANKSHASGDLLFTVPAEYKPRHQIYPIFVQNASVFGSLSFLSTSGKCVINAISSTSASGRLYFSFTYPY